MCDNLRKVTFRLLKDGFQPDLTPEQMVEKMDFNRSRQGYFHRWVEDVDTSREIPCIKPMALVEDAENGKIHMIDFYNLNFTVED